MSKALACARCTKQVPVEEQVKIGRYIYGACCAEKVKTGEKP